MASESVEHGPETVCYSNGPYGLKPFLQCLCGWSHDRYVDNWEEVGQQFDRHLKEATHGEREREEMSGCGVCISSYGDFGDCTGYRCVIVNAGKQWNCSECGDVIPKKSRYELASGFNDGSFWQTKTCLVCADIAEALSCNGRWHGTLWDGVDDIVEKLNIACLYKMRLPESKKKIQSIWLEWLDQELARRRARKVNQKKAGSHE